MRNLIVIVMIVAIPNIAIASDYIILKCDYSQVQSWSDDAPDTHDKTNYYKIYTSGSDRGARYVFDEDEGGWEKEFGRMKIKEGAFEYRSETLASRVYINRRTGDYRTASDLGSVYYYRGNCSPMDGEPELQRPKF